MNFIEEGLKEGDEVWTIQGGNEEVRSITVDETGWSAIKTQSGRYYSSDGRIELGDKYQSLYWSDPHIVSPPKPAPRKYQWLWRRKGSTTWFLSDLYFETSEKFHANDCTDPFDAYEFKRFVPPTEDE